MITPAIPFKIASLRLMMSNASKIYVIIWKTLQRPDSNVILCKKVIPIETMSRRGKLEIKKNLTALTLTGIDPRHSQPPLLLLPSGPDKVRVCLLRGGRKAYQHGQANIL